MKAAVSAIYGVKCRVNYLGVDSEFFRPDGSRRSDYLLSVGSLTPLKGFDFIIHALAEIPAAMRPPLKIISNFANPDEKEYLSMLGRELNLDLELKTGVSEEELRSAYNQAVLTVYAPVREPFGLVTIESMACGTPVVAVEEGGIRETVIDHQVGRLVERDKLCFATAIQSLLADPERREEFGRNGRLHVEEKWSWHRAVERLDEAFKEVTSEYSV
jgi:glycosyltransferase involved in cell wall biosynthesis